MRRECEVLIFLSFLLCWYNVGCRISFCLWILKWWMLWVIICYVWLMLLCCDLEWCFLMIWLWCLWILEKVLSWMGVWVLCVGNWLIRINGFFKLFNVWFFFWKNCCWSLIFWYLVFLFLLIKIGLILFFLL